MGIRRWWLGYPGFWGKLDWLNHHLHCPPLVGRFGVVLVPRALRKWICDRFEASLSDDDWDVPPAVAREWDNPDDAVYDEGIWPIDESQEAW